MNCSVSVLQDLLKHTPEDHPDYLFLQDAQKNIKRLAERINKGRRTAEELERETRVMQEIEAHIEGVEHVRLRLTHAINELLWLNNDFKSIFFFLFIFMFFFNHFYVKHLKLALYMKFAI